MDAPARPVVITHWPQTDSALNSGPTALHEVTKRKASSVASQYATDEQTTNEWTKHFYYVKLLQP